MISWNLNLSKQAHEDLQWFRRKDKSLFVKCFDLTLAVMLDPMHGIGKPEHLKGLDKNIWSRRVSDEHRMVYEIIGREVDVFAYKGHYR